ncbi:hypothetical protein [Marinimicrobium sp. ARAG 43.8]|uniref:hypothetical protein n=1 Tax=Marinimicrobium sp. ARAG 43.8 TaxID=3418719 RepID=UPI003CF39C78
MFLRPFYAILTALLLGVSLSGPTVATAEGIYEAHEKVFKTAVGDRVALPPNTVDHDSEDVGAPFVALVPQSHGFSSPVLASFPFVKGPDAQCPPARASPLYL